MYKATIDTRSNGITVVIIIFSLLFLPILAASPRGFDLNNNFLAMAQVPEASPSSSSSNQTETVVVQTP
jgi:hypothetical protein